MELFLPAFVTLVVIIDPLGTAVVFAALTHALAPREGRVIARKASLIALCVLVFFGLLGGALLRQLGISLDAFRIAGGLLLFVIAFRMLMGDHDASSLKQPGALYADRSHLAVFPIAIPFLSGPGGITAMILLASQARDWQGEALVFAALACAMAAALACMLLSDRLKRVMGASGMVIAARLIGILLAAMSIQFIIDGVRSVIRAG